MRAARLFFQALVSLFVLGRSAQLQAQSSHAADSTTIMKLIQAHAAAWNRHDAHAAAAVYAPAADIRYSSGERIQGRAAVEAAHRAAFAEDTLAVAAGIAILRPRCGSA